MKAGKRVCCTLAAVLTMLAGIGSGGVATMIIAWPDTRSPGIKSDAWTTSLPYLVFTALLFAVAGFLLWVGFRSRMRPPPQQNRSAQNPPL